MSSIADIAEGLRAKTQALHSAVSGAQVPLREIARRVGCSDSTIRYFIRTGSADLATLERIERVVAAGLDAQSGGETGHAA